MKQLQSMGFTAIKLFYLKTFSAKNFSQLFNLFSNVKINELSLYLALNVTRWREYQDVCLTFASLL